MTNGHAEAPPAPVEVDMREVPVTNPTIIEVAPAVTPPGKRLEEAERLKIENMFLRMQNMQLQLQNLDTAKQQLITDMRGVQTDMENYRAELSKKYGVDIGRTTVDTQGNIRIPVPSGA